MSKNLPNSTGSSTPRVVELDTAKGLAIALVVWGHVVARDFKPLDNAWYAAANARLYEFHMAFFFFLAGYVYFLRADPAWWFRWRKTARRLIPAYFLFAGLVYAVKFFAAHFVKVDAPVGNVLADILNQLLYPTKGFASFLWFIIVVLQLQLIAPLLHRTLNGKLLLVIALAFVLHLLAVYELVSEVFALHLVCRYLLFFLLGAVTVKYRNRISPFLDRWMLILLGSFLLVITMAPKTWIPTLGALLSLAALMAAVRFMVRQGWSSWLVFLGLNSFTIYLMNSLAMGLGRAILLPLLGWEGWKFPFIVVSLWILGLLLPVLVQRLVFSRVKALDTITR